MTRSLEEFDSVYGKAEGILEESVPCALLPFIFYLHTRDGKCLRLQITDFHSNTWQTVKTIEQLEDLRDQIGIGGSWDDFLQYIREAFVSENVKLVLGGPASSIGGRGATSARVIAQKCKGMPRVSISLEKLSGPSDEDAMGNISVELLKAFKHQSDVLATEQKSASQLIKSLALEKENSQRLQQQVDAINFTGRKKTRNGASQFSLNDPGESFSQFTGKDPAPEDSKSKKTSKPAPLRTKVHMAHARRAKQRGSRLADVDED